jgi:hypothetical protein
MHAGSATNAVNENAAPMTVSSSAQDSLIGG